MRTATHLLRATAATVLLLTLRAVEAQQVFIPDVDLRAALNAWVPGAVDGNGYLDTQNPSVLAANELDLRVRWTPAYLTGLDALTDLTSLSITSKCYIIDYWYPCSTNAISIPAWPAALHALDLDHGAYTALPPWPPGLTALTIGTLADITGLPALPTQLDSLTITNCTALTAFPDLPASLSHLTLGSSAIPMPVLPPGLTSVQLFAGDGVLLPALPQSIQRVTLNGSSTTSLDTWPSALLELELWNMLALESFAPPPGQVQHMVCVNLPALIALPPWPGSLQTAFLADLLVAELPTLPSTMQGLDISSMSHLFCLPQLPEGMSGLLIDIDGPFFQSTAVTCLPNLPAGMSVQWNGESYGAPADPALLCTILNSTCDFVSPAATGTVYWDQNANGLRDGGEPGFPDAAIHAEPNTITVGVQGDGSFNMPLPLDQYTLTASSDNPYITSISPASHDAPFVNMDDVDANNDFGVVLQPDVQDVSIDLHVTTPVTGFDSYGTISFSSIGSATVSGTITLTFDPNMAWVSADPLPTTINGNVVTWNYAALTIGQADQIHFVLHTDANVPLGTPVSHVATIDPLATDQAPTDNVSTANDVVVGSFDPNDKRVEPASLSPAEVIIGEELVYTIRFQNTGTYPASRIVVEDGLSADLHWNTMRFLSSSHPCTWVLLNDGTLRFMFDPISLPDSTSDEAGSHGFVRFAIKPVSSLMLGESVTNTAAIHFDFNAPVITNEAVFTVETSTDVAEEVDDGIVLFPSPAEGSITVAGLWPGTKQLVVRDALGRTVMLASTNELQRSIPIHTWPAGSYSLQVLGGDRSVVRTFVKR